MFFVSKGNPFDLKSMARHSKIPMFRVNVANSVTDGRMLGLSLYPANVFGLGNNLDPSLILYKKSQWA